VNDDAQLIGETLAGHSAAFGGLVQKYQDRLYNTLLHVVGHAEDARDIVQDAFVQAFLKLDTFHGNSAFYTWLYRIALNTAATRRRRRKTAASIDQAREHNGIEPIDHGEGPGDLAQRRETRDQVRRALDELSEDHRAILVLREIDGCCYETIAEILDLPIGTVRSRLHRARLHLRDQLKEVLIADR
jgi:RNA polymerase sigma-70 factor, ECF subfamily